MATIVRIIPDRDEIIRRRPKAMGIVEALLYLFFIIVFVVSPFCFIYPIGLLGGISYAPVAMGVFWVIRYLLIICGYGLTEDLRILTKLLNGLFCSGLGYVILCHLLMYSKPGAGYITASYILITIVVLLLQRKKLLNKRTYVFYANVCAKTKEYGYIIYVITVMAAYIVTIAGVGISPVVVKLTMFPTLLLFWLVLLSKTKLLYRYKSIVGCMIIVFGLTMLIFSVTLFLLDYIDQHPMWTEVNNDGIGLLMFTFVIGLLTSVISITLGLRTSILSVCLKS